MPRRKRTKRVTYSLAVKRGKTYKPLPRRTLTSKKPVKAVYLVKKVNGVRKSVKKL